MESNIRVRSNIFGKLMKIGWNQRNWEMLCSSDKPLVPFIGAGISAWCYKTWDLLLKDVVKDNFSEECSKIVVEALGYWEHKPDVEEEKHEQGQEVFRWMEEIAEYIFDDDEDEFKNNKNKFKLKREAVNQQESGSDQQEANRILDSLHRYLGGYGVNTRQAAVKSLYKAFDIARMKTAEKIPEYQSFFPRLFPDLLVTTNYDKALERFYPSIFSYSYRDLGKEDGSDADKESWLYRAVEEKLDLMQASLKGMDKAANIAVPDVPMLLKVHGSIEQASNIALSRGRYDKVYKGKMPELFGKICRRSSLLFMGCGLREDRILDELKKQKNEAEQDGDYGFRHFAFYPEPEKEEDLKKLNVHLAEYGIYPIFYKKDVLLELFDNDETEWHSDCLGILLENLLRRKMHYHQPLEMLWDKSRFMPLEMSGSMKNAARIQSINESSQYVHVEEASQIWELLKSSAECPLIAITGDTGSGKSTFCQNIQKLNKNPKDAMQFFYISLEDCKTWNEFCLQIYQNLNIVTSGIEEMESYLTVAEQIERRCSGYWRSVLIFDHLDELKDEAAYPGQWDAIKKMLAYWKEHQTRVIFTTREYPKGISCYTWHIDTLMSDEAEKVFFSACTSRRHERRSLLEQNVLNELFSRQTFRPASAYLLGRYADSKNDLATLLEEWESCHMLGESEEQTLARLMWNHLKDEHQWSDKVSEDDAEKLAIEENILWIWGILGSYPGIFPKAFLECIWSDKPGYQNKELSLKTLMFMKNAGLCEEMIDEKYGFLLENMIKCARKFSSKLGCEDEKYRELNFAENVNLDGLKNFYGYTMDKYDGDLRKHILEEWKKERAGMPNLAKMEVPDIILDILEALGEEVKSDEKRKGHKELNLVLHYEIKTVIRFLLTQLSRRDTEKNSDDRIRIAKIGCHFSHYYHYVPSHALPLVQQLLEIAEESATGRGGKNASEGFAPYEVANLHKVMGDIHRLLGRKEGAKNSYTAAKELCDSQMLLSFTDFSSESYRESQRIKASILLTQNFYGPNASSEVAEAEALYQRLGDKWGNAYYNQRTGESIIAEEPDPSCEKECFEKVCKRYNAAAEHYGQVEDMTGIAYILKCMGDLIGEYRNVYDDQELSLWKTRNGSAVYYKILASNEELLGGEKIAGSSNDGIFAAACCYAQAFTLYCRHVNWRGFANVLQGMGNLLRYNLLRKKYTLGNEDKPLDPKEFEEIETLYGFAEECYRWLGDMRGLADTLDYAGHGYKEKGDDVAEYMALGKWMESEEIWRGQGNDAKVKKTAREIRDLRKKVNNDRREGNRVHEESTIQGDRE